MPEPGVGENAGVSGLYSVGAARSGGRCSTRLTRSCALGLSVTSRGPAWDEVRKSAARLVHAPYDADAALRQNDARRLIYVLGGGGLYA